MFHWLLFSALAYIKKRPYDISGTLLSLSGTNGLEQISSGQLSLEHEVYPVIQSAA